MVAGDIIVAAQEGPMDWYTLVKFLHVAFAIIWLGGALSLIVLGAAAYRASKTAEFTSVIRNVVYMAPRVFVPSGLAVLVMGLIMAFLGDLWGQLWVILGLVGFAVTFGLGI